MTFKEQYLQSLSVKPTPPPAFPVHSFAGTFYELLPDTIGLFPTVLSGGTVELPSEHSLSLNPLDCYMLLYTRSGRGTLRIHSKAYPLEPGKLLCMDCNVFPHIMETANLSWRFSIFMIQGNFFSQLFSLVPFDYLLLQSLSDYSPVLSGLEQLLCNDSGANLYNKLIDASLLWNIAAALMIDSYHLEPPAPKCAPYLLEIKQYLDMYFDKPFRLDDLEERYHISKYRICHEFSKTFHTPPLKYLNTRRLEAAVHLLLTTDKHIHEIAMDVGYDNTNHFINLFKREKGVTPQVFRDTNKG